MSGVTRLPRYLTRQAERRPEAVALVAGNDRMTYGELEQRSNQIARLLRVTGTRAPSPRTQALSGMSPMTCTCALPRARNRRRSRPSR